MSLFVRWSRLGGMRVCAVGLVGCEDRGARLYQWLRADFVPPSPLLVIKARRQSPLVFWSSPHLVDAEFCKARMPYFCRSGHLVVTVEQFLEFVGLFFLPQEPVLELIRTTSQDLFEVAKATAGGLDDLAWNEVKALLPSWCSGLAVWLSVVESTGVWPQGLLDAYTAMILKVDGDSTPLEQRFLCVLPVVYRLWASLRLTHFEGFG